MISDQLVKLNFEKSLLRLPHLLLEHIYRFKLITQIEERRNIEKLVKNISLLLSFIIRNVVTVFRFNEKKNKNTKKGFNLNYQLQLVNQY